MLPNITENNTSSSPSSTGISNDTQVLFVASFNEAQRTFLLSNSACLLYTPSNEHFGIVPIEAMYAGLPVIAVKSGGPTESVVHGTTGYLCEPKEDEFASSIQTIFSSQERAAIMGQQGRLHVSRTFSIEKFSSSLNEFIGILVKGVRQSGGDDLENHLMEGRWTFIIFFISLFSLFFLLLLK